MHASIFFTLQMLSTLPFAFSVPAKPPITNTTALPLRFGVLLWPGYQALDAFSLIDVLSMVHRPILKSS